MYYDEAAAPRCLITDYNMVSINATKLYCTCATIMVVTVVVIVIVIEIVIVSLVLLGNMTCWSVITLKCLAGHCDADPSGNPGESRAE